MEVERNVWNTYVEKKELKSFPEPSSTGALLKSGINFTIILPATATL